MKRLSGIILTILFFYGSGSAIAETCRNDCNNPPPSVVISEKEYETAVPGCTRHFLLVRETTKTYSPNDVRVSRLYTIYNSDGSVIISNCTNVEHLIDGENHYFLINNKQIVDEFGNPVSDKTYNSAAVIAQDRIKVSQNQGFMKTTYGIVNYKGQEIVPLIYKKIKQSKINNQLYFTQKGGYYGIIDLNNNILLRNEYDSVKELHNTYVFKKYSYYGLADINGKIILRGEYEKIERLGEYIKVKKSGKWGVLDRNGQRICDTMYKDIKLERNTLYAKNNGGYWIRL